MSTLDSIFSNHHREKSKNYSKKLFASRPALNGEYNLNELFQ